MADGKIEFKLSADTKDALKKLNEARQRFVKIGASLEAVNAKIKQFEDMQMRAASTSSKEYRKLLVIQQSLTQEEEKRAQVEQALAQIRQKAQEQLADTEGKLEDAIEKNIEAVERLHFLQRQQQAYMEANQTPSKFLEEDIDKQKSIVSQTEMNLEVISKIAEEERKKIGTTKEEISLQKQLAAIKEKIAKLEQKESFQKRDYKNARDADYQQWIDLQRQKDQLTAQLSAAGKNVETAREGFFSAQNMAALQKIVMGVGKAFAFASKNALRLAKAITIDPLIKGFKKLTNGVRSFGRRLKFVVLQGLLFRNMRKYLSEFAQSLGAAMKKNDQFSASLANLKGTFWASIAPVVDALAPILARFLDMIAKLITYLSGLVGILFKIGKASKTAGAGLASAGESAKDAGNNLASWDTIQNLDTGGGGDSGSGISPTFGQDFDEAYERLEKLRELLEAGDWFEIGKYVGEKLSEVITVINNWITGTLYPWVQKWATNLGQFINGFFVGMDWSTLGATVGNAIITVFDGISTFLETVDWHKVGESVKEFLLGINWSEVLKSVGTAIGNALIAAIDFTEGLTGLDLSGLEKAFKNLLDYINNLIDLITGKKSFEEWFNDLSDGEAIITAIVVALGSLAAIIGVIIGLFMLWKAVKGIISALTSPIGLVILAIAAVIAIVVLLIKHWDEVKAKLKEVWNALVQVWEDIKTMFKAVINVVLDVLKYIWGLWKEFTDRVDLVFEALWEDIKTIFNAVVNFVVGGVKKLIEWVKKFWSDVKTTWKLTVDSTKQFIDQIKGYIEAFKAKVVSIIDNIKTKATTVINAIRDGIKGAINFIIRFINGLISRVESAINTIISGINRLGFTIPDWIPVIGGKHLGLSLNSIYLGRVPELAQGTVVNPGHQFAAILGDNRHEQEIVSPLSTMKQALIEALQESGNSGSGQLVINLDGKQIANAVIPRINNRTRMYGTSVIL